MSSLNTSAESESGRPKRRGPGRQASSVGLRIRDRHRAGLAILLEACEYAMELQRCAWDFAVEGDELRRAGLSSSDIRWLICNGLVDHAHERRSVEDDQRAFQSNGRLTFRRNSCFVLTEAGAVVAREVLSQSAQEVGPVRHERGYSRPSIRRLLPTWDPDLQQLRLGDTLVKEFKVPAANQEQVLAVFEEEGWPVHIDDPLPPRLDQDPKQRLHTTINALNRNQKNQLIRFRGDGRGQGVRWELIGLPADGQEADDGGA